MHKLKALLRSAQVVEFLKYCVVGGIAFVADTASLMLFYHFVFGEFSFDLLFLHIADGRTAAATAVGFLVGLVVNYVLSVLFVFNRPGQQEKGKSVGAFLVFGVVGLIGLALTELGMMLGVGLLGDRFLLPVKIVVAGIVMVWNYLGRKIFVYGGKNAGNGKKGEEKERSTEDGRHHRRRPRRADGGLRAADQNGHPSRHLGGGGLYRRHFAHRAL